MDAKISADKKARVLSSAEMVFLQQGYARTTMGDLAGAAGMSRPALYLIYPRKHEVFSSIIRDEAECGSAQPPRREAADIQNWIVWVCDLWLGERQKGARSVSAEAPKSPQRPDSAAKEADFLQSILESGLARRLPKGTSSELRACIARVLTSFVSGLVESRLSAVERRRLLAFQADVLTQALACPERFEAMCDQKTTV